MSAASPNGTILSLSYDFHQGNDNGNVWGITNNKDASRSQTFTYDPLNRLISAQNAGTDCSQMTLTPQQTKYWGNNYGYDAWGNLLSKSVTKCSGEGLSVTALPTNQLQGYVYDIAGNAIQDATSGQHYTYDQENRITGAAGYTYTYDSDGNRVEKSNGSTGTLYWYMAAGIVAETDLSGNPQSEYVFFDGERVARKDFPNNAVSYYFSDHLKTTDIVTDAQGNIKNESDFYPWGGELQFLANDSNHYKFTGKERDSETGLDYFGARYYSNGLGRFITPDWSATPVPVPYADLEDPQTLCQYCYVRGLPTVRADLDGHGCLTGPCWFDGIPQGVVNWAWHNSPIGQGVDAIRGGIRDLHDGGTATGAKAMAQAQTTATVLAAAGGNPLAQADLVSSAVNTFKNMSSVDKTATVTEGALNIGVAVLSGKVSAPAIEEPIRQTTSLPREGIYEGPDAMAPGKTYVGQSGDIPSRITQHEASGRFAPGANISATEVTGGKTAREIAEHKRIQQLGGVSSQAGSQTSNIRRPIGPKREHLLTDSK
jgi:RHS repeat-associated protein